ncbi:unknown transmembrane protein [Mesoplasma florum W37]|uniref:Uncharacterized protein n=1 Tax=Mesoplasma florum TaxID=2151 RepID=A0AAD0MN81_MESFO|nr:unknown transmembrane protein [Mesoplasma florum]AGY41412.1 unknown transmembrane protein [Mesoplasma florum W37]AVN59631.1 hypothetical protein CG008_01795 [Mesoplasma florum]AVN65753.1 hypothetical protein MflW12_3480 [Mesoplasma florum]
MKFGLKKQGITLIVISSLYGIGAIASTIPGLGIESIRFINSVKKQLQIIMPKDKYVLDAESPLYEPIMHNVIRTSYLADAISTIDSFNAAEKDKFTPLYTDFTNAWYTDRWQPVIDQKQNIDFYDIATDMIKFDQAIASEFQSYGYVNTGTQWIFHKNGISEIFSRDLRENAIKQQSVWDQDEYEDLIESTGPGLTGITVKQSPGTKLVNNKVWFLNQQIDSIKYAISIQSLQNPFVNKNLRVEDVADYVTIDDLYHPNFTRGLTMAQLSFIFMLSAVVVSPTCLGFGIWKYKKWEKSEKVESAGE